MWYHVSADLYGAARSVRSSFFEWSATTITRVRSHHGSRSARAMKSPSTWSV